MFDEIFKRWVTTGQLTKNDIVPLFLEWNQTFGDGKGTPQEVNVLMNLIQADYRQLMEKILHDVGVKKGHKWEEVWNIKNGRFITRFLIENNNN